MEPQIYSNFLPDSKLKSHLLINLKNRKIGFMDSFTVGRRCVLRHSGYDLPFSKFILRKYFFSEFLYQ